MVWPATRGRREAPLAATRFILVILVSAPGRPFTKIRIGVNRVERCLCLAKNAALVWEMSPAGQLDQISFVGYETDRAHFGESEFAVNL